MVEKQTGVVQAKAETITPADNSERQDARDSTRWPDCKPCRRPVRAAGQNNADKLIELIRSTVGVGTWSECGGAATIQFFPNGQYLAIKQTQAEHERITELLAAVQRVQDVEVAVETLVVGLSPDMAQNFENLAGFQDKTACDPRQSGKRAVLSDKQVASWLKVFQMQQTTDVMQSPKITVFNGQAASINIGDEAVKVGLFVKILPVVSADGKSVRLHIDLTDTAVSGEPGTKLNVQTLTLDKVAELNDGATIVYRLGRKVIEYREEIGGPPILSEIPYLNRLFTSMSVTREERDVFVFVKTKVIVDAEQERAYRGEAAAHPAVRVFNPCRLARQGS